MRLPKVRRFAELRNVASGSATQDPWLGNRKVGSQVVGEDRSRLPGRGTVDACKLVVCLLGNAWKSFYIFEGWEKGSHASMWIIQFAY